ncbi:anti-sigma factor family protein [Planctomycetota bacterium]
MEKSCQEIEEMLVDYTDGQLSPDNSSQVTEHLAQCEACRKVLDALQKSLELAGVIWADGLSETENIRIPASRKVRKFSRLHYAAIAASILLVVTTSVVWRALVKPEQTEITFAEIERRITESASAARLLAATELLAKVPDTQSIVDQQYRYIVETYPETTAANKAKLKIK